MFDELYNSQSRRPLVQRKCQLPVCMSCPYASTMNYIERIVYGDFDASLRLNFMANLFPHILGRGLYSSCETACRRGAIDKPVSICALKRSAADFAAKNPPKSMHIEKTGKRIAIIGSGPSGLAAAHDLAIKVMMLSSMSPFRLPVVC